MPVLALAGTGRGEKRWHAVGPAAGGAVPHPGRRRRMHDRTGFSARRTGRRTRISSVTV